MESNGTIAAWLYRLRIRLNFLGDEDRLDGNFLNLSNNLLVLLNNTDEGCVFREDLIFDSNIWTIFVRFIDVGTSCQLEERVAI